MLGHGVPLSFRLSQPGPIRLSLPPMTLLTPATSLTPPGLCPPEDRSHIPATPCPRPWLLLFLSSTFPHIRVLTEEGLRIRLPCPAHLRDQVSSFYCISKDVELTHYKNEQVSCSNMQNSWGTRNLTIESMWKTYFPRAVDKYGLFPRRMSVERPMSSVECSRNTRAAHCH